MPFVHNPFAAPTRPFSIGLQPLGIKHWLEPDAARTGDLAEKSRLIAERPEIVIRSSPETLASERDMLARLARHLREDHGISIPDQSQEGEPPLVTASRHVQDDLCLMRFDGTSWRLAAACLCFPASWSLAEKIGRPMDAIHADVPGWAGGMAERVARIFTHLQPGQPVWRLNWSMDDGFERHRPAPKKGPKAWRDQPDRVAHLAHVRVERQTLYKSPLTGDILFTIRTYLDPLRTFAGHPQGRALATGLRKQLAALDEAQLTYKGLLTDREMLLEALGQIVNLDK